MSDPASNPSDPLTVDVPKAVSTHTSVAGRLRNYFLSGLVVAIGLIVALRQLQDTRQDQITQQRLTQEGQITGRFTAATAA